MPLRRLIVLCVLMGVPILGWLAWRNISSHRQPMPGPTIEKQPVAFAIRTFDPSAPPADMPPLRPGEEAQCDSNFLSNASVGGEAERNDVTHAIVTITRIKVTLQLNVTIWAPNNASQHVLEHEEGHRQISEYYYQSADKLAERIAARHMGEHLLVTGTNLDAEFSKVLQQMGADITAEYNKALNPEPAQLRYDAITDHSRNDVVAKDAVAQALKEIELASTQPGTNPGN